MKLLPSSAFACALWVAAPSIALDGAQLGASCSALPDIESEFGSVLVGSLSEDTFPTSIFFKRGVPQGETTISYWCDGGGIVRDRQSSLKMPTHAEAARFFAEERDRLVQRLGQPHGDQLDPENPHLRNVEAAIDSELTRLAYWTGDAGAFVLMIFSEKDGPWEVTLVHN